MPVAITALWSRLLLVSALLGYSVALADTWESCNDSMLLEGSWGQDVKVVADLLQKGANPNAVGAGGRTALHRAAQGGHLKVMRLLIDHGAKVDAKDESGRSVLTEAVGSQAPQAVKLLLEAGAKPDSAALAQACWLGRMEAVKLLLDAGVSPDAGIVEAAQARQVEIVRLLLDKGANVNAKSRGGNSALHNATLQGGFEVVQLLIQSGANPNAVNDRGETPLHTAICGNCDIKNVKVLVQLGAKLDRPNLEGITPVRLAAIRHAKEAYEWLVAANEGKEPRPRFDTQRTQQAPKSTRELLAALSSDKEESRLAAQRELIACGTQAVPDVIKHIESGADFGRIYELLAAMGPDAEGAMPLLRSQLSNKEYVFSAAVTIERIRLGALNALPDETKQKAAAALYEAIVDPEADVMAGFCAGLLVQLGEPAVPTILRLMQHESPACRLAAVESLVGARFADERIETQLILLAQGDKKRFVRGFAALALGEYGGKSQKARSALLSIVTTPPPLAPDETDPKRIADRCEWQDTADHAARSLGLFGPSVIEDLMPVLSPLDAPARQPAIIALQCIGASAVPRLIELLAHKDQSVAISASVALNRIGQPAVPALAKAVSTGNEQVADHAANALWWIGRGAKDAIPSLLEVAGSDRRSDASRLAAVRAAQRIDAAGCRKSETIRSTIPLLIRILENGEFKHQCWAAETLGTIGAPARDALPTLRKRLELPDENLDTNGLVRDCVQRTSKDAISAIEADLDSMETR